MVGPHIEENQETRKNEYCTLLVNFKGYTLDKKVLECMNQVEILKQGL